VLARLVWVEVPGAPCLTGNQYKACGLQRRDAPWRPVNYDKVHFLQLPHKLPTSLGTDLPLRKSPPALDLICKFRYTAYSSANVGPWFGELLPFSPRTRPGGGLDIKQSKEPAG
jgi:hypothetical protein